MKSIFTSLVVAVTLVQCTTTPEGKKAFDPVRAVTVVNATVPSAVRIGVSKQPAATKYLRDIALTIDTFADGKDFDPKAFTEALSSVKLDLPSSAEALAVIDIVTALYNASYANVVKDNLDKHELVPLLKAISASIKKGLT